jgi:hypothetical protein
MLMTFAFSVVPRVCGSAQARNQSTRPSDLVLIDGVIHDWVNARVDISAKLSQDARALVDPRERDVRIDIATAEQHASTRQRAPVLPHHAVRADETGAQPNDGTIVARVACRELERQASSLREAHKDDPAWLESLRHQAVDDRSDVCERL